VDVDELLTTTRAVRKRLDLERPVPRAVVLECLRLALQAPTGGNTQRWRWLVVDDPEVRTGLADLYRKACEPYMAAQTKAVEAAGRMDDMRRIIDSTMYLADHLAEVPVHVIPDTVTQVALLPVAYTKGTDFKPANRRSVEEVTYFNGWKRS
jgi:nitroreductase